MRHYNYPPYARTQASFVSSCYVPQMRMGTRSTLAQRIVRNGTSSKPDEHLSTLLGQQSCYSGNDTTLKLAIEILQKQGADSERQQSHSRHW